PQDHHALDRLVVAGAPTFAAERVGTILHVQDLHDLACIAAVAGLVDLHDRLGLASVVIDGPPASHRRLLCARDGGQEKQAGKHHHAKGHHRTPGSWSLGAGSRTGLNGTDLNKNGPMYGPFRVALVARSGQFSRVQVWCLQMKPRQPETSNFLPPSSSLALD